MKTLKIEDRLLYRAPAQRGFLSRQDVARLLKTHAGIPAKVRQEYLLEAAHGYLRLVDDPLPALSAREFVAERKTRFDTMIVVGIGGSSLGAKMLMQALCAPFHNLLPARRRRGGKLFFAENPDARTLAGLLEIVDWKRTLVNVISKSGNTPETVANFLTLLRPLKRATGRRWTEHVIATTGQQGPLFDWAQEHAVGVFPIPAPVGGRFSVLSPVGLLPAAFAGINVAKLVKGAGQCARDLLHARAGANAAFRLAVQLHALRERHGKTQLVMMPYGDALAASAEWFRQLWAESLGKKRDVRGAHVRAGQTPIQALGAVDQHSQLQLYAEGPLDKVVLFLAPRRAGAGMSIPDAAPEAPEFAYLTGHRLRDLLEAEQRATAQSLHRSGCPGATLEMAAVNETTLGALIVFLELLTTYSAELYRVNAYDQPGVEEGKRLARAMLAKRRR